MNSIILYHGSTEIVKYPVCHFGRKKLDFGRGFYLTQLREQAVEWANNLKDLRKSEQALVNVYSFHKEEFFKEANCKVFTLYNQEWLEFIVANREGNEAAAPYDYIEGGIANDRVIDTINMYLMGYYNLDQSLRLLSLHQPNNQVCFRNQALTDKYLRYERTEIA